MSEYQKLSSNENDSDYPPSECPSPPPNWQSAKHRSSFTTSRIVQLLISTILLVLVLLITLSLAPASALKTLLFLNSDRNLPPPSSIDWSTTPASSSTRNNVTIVILVNPGSDVNHKLLPTLANIEEKFNRRLGYPIQLLTNDQLPSEAVMNRTSWITGGKAKWSLVTAEDGWGAPSWISPEEIQHSVETIGFSEGYRNMCRFFSMYHYKHPALANYEYIWRLDDTSRFHCSLMEDPIELMKNASAVYGYSNIQTEAYFVVPTLWETTLKFLEESKAKAKGWFREEEGENWLQLISNDGGKNYNLRMFYNNFEIVHRSLFESPAYQAYVSYLDKAGGFYRERWGDAPVRTIATSLFLPRWKFYDFSQITGYQHDDPEFVCPNFAWCDCDPEKSGRNSRGNW